MAKQDLRSAMAERVLTGDGAMGTYLYQLGFPVGVSYEEFNLDRPDVIMDVHRQYYEAGARVIETNTYSANRDKLSKFGLEQEVAAINRAGVELARQAAGEDAYVVGSIGSLSAGRRRPAGKDRVADNVKEQAEALLSAGADGILLETFYVFEELLASLQAVRGLSGTIPVICQLATDGSGFTLDGVGYADAFLRLKEEGADVAGFNCHSGPNGILRAVQKLPPDFDNLGMPLSVFPNAGLPGIVDGRYTYLATPDYFAETAKRFAVAGARIVGGCCGTTPAHIAAIAAAIGGYVPAPAGTADRAGPGSAPAGAGADTGSPVEVRERPQTADIPPSEGALAPATAAPAQQQPADAPAPSHAAAALTSAPSRPTADAAPGQPAAEPSILDLVRTRHTVIVELDSPRDLAIEKFMKGAAVLKEAGVDAVTMADNSLAQTRMSNLSVGYLVKDKLGLRPLLHIACRDRNLIGTQSHLMGLHALGIDHVLAVTGDPARVGDLPGASSVYDLTSFDLIRMTKQLNEGIAFSGKQLKQKASFVVGSAFDPNVKYLEKAVQRMEKKIEAGADYFMTQPVYDTAVIKRLYDATKHLATPIFIGIMPLVTGRNAEFLHNEVPGIRIPEDVRKRMAGLEGVEGRRMGVDIAKELVDEAVKYFKGIYFMTPMLFYEMTADLTRHVWEQTGSRPDIQA